jgi:hypothetical protein
MGKKKTIDEKLPNLCSQRIFYGDFVEKAAKEGENLGRKSIRDHLRDVDVAAMIMLSRERL